MQQDRQKILTISVKRLLRRGASSRLRKIVNKTHGADLSILFRELPLLDQRMLFDMLDDRFTTPELRERFATQPLYPSFIQVSLGVNRDLSAVPHAVKVETALPFEIAGQTRRALWYQHFAFDPTMAPQGRTSITVLYPSDLAWWENLGYNGEEYRAEKKRILDTIRMGISG